MGKKQTEWSNAVDTLRKYEADVKSGALVYRPDLVAELPACVRQLQAGLPTYNGKLTSEAHYIQDQCLEWVAELDKHPECGGYGCDGDGRMACKACGKPRPVERSDAPKSSELATLRRLHKTLLEAPCREHGGMGGYAHHAPETCWPCLVRSLFPAIR